MAQGRDLEFSRLLLCSVLAALRAACPDIRASAASLDVWRATDRHGRRWRVFRFGTFMREDYSASAFEARAAGWLAWMQQEGVG